MKAELIRIGNSRGIRIPKPIIEQCGLGNTVELRVEGGCIVIAPSRALREGWKEAFAAAEPKGDDLRMWRPLRNEFDREEWTW